MIWSRCCAVMQGDAHVGLALALAVSMGYLYQGPPFRSAHRSFLLAEPG